jgi:hypothetical protein
MNHFLSLATFIRLVVSIDGFPTIEIPPPRCAKSYYYPPSVILTTTRHLGQPPRVLSSDDSENHNDAYYDSIADAGVRESTATATEIMTVTSSRVLGNIFPIRVPGQDDSFLGNIGVPTFRADGSYTTVPLRNDQSLSMNIREVEALTASLGHGPALLIDNLLSESACRDIIDTCEHIGFGKYQAGKNHHGAMQILVANSTVEQIAQFLAPHIDLNQVQDRRLEMIMMRLGGINSGPNENENILKDWDNHHLKSQLRLVGLNRRWRIYKYAPGGIESFQPHIDAGFPPSGLSPDGTELVWDASHENHGNHKENTMKIVSRLTILFYLNDAFVGGETNFYVDKGSQFIASVRPQTGSCLIFPQGVGEAAVEYARNHWPLHEGSPVIAGDPKYVIRSDILFQETI